MPPPRRASARVKAGAAPRSAKKAKKKSEPGASAAPADGGAPPPPTPVVWRPGVDALDDGEALDYDPSAYDCLHAFQLDWPCLSFDVLRDGLGSPRTAFPHEAYMVAGTQAASAKANTLVLVRLARLGQGRHGDRAPGSDDVWESSDSDAEPDAVLSTRALPLGAGANRVRACPQAPGLVAVWREDACVQAYDLAERLQELQALPAGQASRLRPVPAAPAASHAAEAEGFALDWSPRVAGRLAAGDCAAGLVVWEPASGGRWAVSARYAGHTASVEDVQWSPTEDTVFLTASADRSLRVWDTRARAAGAQVVVPDAHSADVNVAAWCRGAAFMLATGGDDGLLKAWDLRAFRPGGEVASLVYHCGPVTSVEWSPFEPSVLATTGADAQLAVWDLALERDPDEEAALGTGAAAAPADVPPQLLFVHAGQADPKEAHWHPHVPGLLACTAADGFHVFKPANV